MSEWTRLVRAIRHLFLIVGGVVVAAFCYCICQGVFAHYPQYHTDVLTYVAVGLIVVTGGSAWIIDHRRIHDDD